MRTFYFKFTKYLKLLYLIKQVTENTAIILDECGILTTCRGETFVKGAGYIKTYYVPLSENFNLIKKKNSMDFYRIEDRSRYYAVRARKFSNHSDSSSVYGYSTFNVRKSSFNSLATDDSFDIGNAGTATPMEDIEDERFDLYGPVGFNEPVNVYKPTGLNEPDDEYEPDDLNIPADFYEPDDEYEPANLNEPADSYEPDDLYQPVISNELADVENIDDGTSVSTESEVKETRC